MAKLNRKYPHLLAEDIEIWLAFLETYGNRFTSFDYDVRVGKGRPAQGDHTPEIQKMAIDLSQKRIDAVGHTDGAIMIIEITPHAGMKTIGQLMTYPILYKETFNPTLPVFPLLVCRELNPDIKPALDSMKCPFYIV